MNYAPHLRKMAAKLREQAAFLDEIAQGIENEVVAQTQAKVPFPPAPGVVNTTQSLRRVPG